MVTRLSGSPLFAKSRLKKLIKAASGSFFYARQRVTTEGKAMKQLIEFLKVLNDDLSVMVTFNTPGLPFKGLLDTDEEGLDFSFMDSDGDGWRYATPDEFFNALAEAGDAVEFS